MQSTLKLFGKRVKEIRKRCHITQEELSEMVCLDNQTISRIETGCFFTSYENLEKMALVLNTEIKDFFDFNHLKNKDDLKKVLLKKIDSLEVQDLQRISKFINEFI